VRERALETIGAKGIKRAAEGATQHLKKLPPEKRSKRFIYTKKAQRGDYKTGTL